MRLVGYGDRLSVEPGAEIGFMVSSEAERFDASVIRLIHGDVSPMGPGFRSEPVDSELAGQYPGVHQELRTGSYVRVRHDGALDLPGSLTIHMWIRPTMPDGERQTLISRVSAAGVGFALRLERGRLSLQVGPDPDAVVTLGRPVELHSWYAVTAVFDAAAGEARLVLEPVASTAGRLADAVTGPLRPGEVTGSGDVLIAGELVAEGDGRAVGNLYNGKIDAPRLFDRALAGEELEQLRTGDLSRPGRAVAAWDLSLGISTSVVTDVSGNGLDGRTVNKPMRGATGWRWDGSETAWPHAPDQYGAIHFHDDDLDDAGWERSLGWTVPEDLPSGLYAVELRAGEDEDHIPFVVRPRRGRPTARILFLVPTFSYLAYANEHLLTGPLMGPVGEALGYPRTPQDRYVVETGMNSLYDLHTDGSGVCYASRLRPLVTMRPKYAGQLLDDGRGSPHQLNADLHLVDWLHHGGYEFDVATDDDLHAEGIDLLEPYGVVLTGSHHEYWSIEMIRATQQYLGRGGRLMYLSGNGMYWVTQPDPETGNGIEIRRRGPATRMWEPEPGEAHLSATGELGGLWRFRGQAPQTWLGVGFTAQGFSAGRPYDRRPDSFDERAAWIFEGIGDDERIGDFPSLVSSYGAAGFEVDRADHALGTPHHTLVLATASGFSNSYQHASEEVLVSTSAQGGAVDPRVRADMVLLEYPNGGAVFSPGSVTWCACLSHHDYDNNVSRITRNVLDRFASGSSSVDRSSRRP